LEAEQAEELRKAQIKIITSSSTDSVNTTTIMDGMMMKMMTLTMSTLKKKKMG
jgi:hypothetical protein